MNPPQGNRDANVRETAKGIAEAINEVLPQGWGFFLVMMPFKLGEGRVNYISNCERSGVITMVKNMLRQLEENPNDFGTHNSNEKV